MSDKVMRDVASRTKGEVYLGVVGSVRSGKSTFIRHFMERKVLPYLSDQGLFEKVRDELPQSSEGKTIMTVEPKFVPSNNIKVSVGSDLTFSVRLVDCVGYVIPSAKGYLNEDGSNRLVKTPWFGEDIPFEEAASIGTRKVIQTHSHIGIVMTSDGSFGEFKRQEFEPVEEEIVKELQELGKPFIIILNTATPQSEATKKLAQELAKKYQVSVLAINVLNLTEEDIDLILKEALNEFDISEVNLNIPDWVQNLDNSLSYKRAFTEQVNQTSAAYRKMKDIFSIQKALKDSDLFEKVEINNIDSGLGVVDIDLECSEEAYQRSIEEIIGKRIEDKGDFINLLQDYANLNRVYAKLAPALKMVDQCGYGIAVPGVEDMKLEEPELVKQSGRYGIRLKANAPAIHLVKVDIESTFEPIIGSSEQSQVLIDHMIADYQKNPDKLWNSEIFGRKLCDVINDGVKAKIYAIPDNVQYKFKETLSKVINHGKGGIIAIIL